MGQEDPTLSVGVVGEGEGGEGLGSEKREYKESLIWILVKNLVRLTARPPAPTTPPPAVLYSGV